MSSVECLRDFVSERLTAAAEEIFGVFSKTIVEYEEEIARQCRLLGIVWKPNIKSHRIELPQQHVCKEEEVLSDQQLCDQERNSSLDQEDSEPPQIKEEQEELCIGQEGEQLVVKQEDDTIMLIPAYEESDHSESESNSDHQLLSHNSLIAESGDQKGGVYGDSGSSTNAETTPQNEHQESTSHSNNEYNSTIHSNTHTGKVSYKCGTCEKTFRYKSKLQRHLIVHTGEKPYLCTTCGKRFCDNPALKKHMRIHTGEKPFMEGEQLVVKLKPDTFMLTPTYEESDHNEDHTMYFEDDLSQSATEKETIVNISVKSSVLPESNAGNHLLSHNSHEGESQDHKGGEHRDSASTRNADTKLKKRLRMNVCRSQLNTCADTKFLICDYCGKDCENKSKLVRHIISHTGEKPCFCNTCGRGFRDMWTLRRHTMVHTSARPFPCKLCGRNFRLKKHLEDHLAIHAGKRPFKCEICGKRYSRMTIMKRHLSIHTSEKRTCQTLESSVMT
ncbi:uncharacterized protein [Pagrus major]|uniref:uncharacterized protein n=1 Tax=Pagrus major TaxID=143350 RepID=UPI003CC8A815